MKDIDNLQIGIAGEHIVCADLILKGCIAFPSEQGLPFDLVVEFEDRLLKVQVKTTRTFSRTPQRVKDIPVYRFSVGINGKNRRWNRYKESQVDFFALVELDNKTVAYIPNKDASSTMNFRVPEFRGQYHDEQGAILMSKVEKLKIDGLTNKQISKELKISVASVHKYTNGYDLKQKGTNAGTYFDELTFEKCMNSLTKQPIKDTKPLHRN